MSSSRRYRRLSPAEWARIREAGLVERQEHEAHKLTPKGARALTGLVSAREIGRDGVMLDADNDVWITSRPNRAPSREPE